MRFCLFLGTGLSLVSIGYAIFTALMHLMFYRQTALPGIATIITAIFFFSGVILSSSA